MAKPFLIVGLGASAGGLSAFKSFLRGLSPNPGMAFVLVQHLNPSAKSMLTELLRPNTAMQVVEAADGMPVEPDHVYVIPPDATLTISQGILRLAKPAPERAHRHPIDTFFTSLGSDQGENAVCIVLSGSGSDGTLGLRAIKEHGGLAMAQAKLDSTAQSGMPHSASATGLVDFILPVEELPAKLIQYGQHLQEVNQRKAEDGTRKDVVDRLADICGLLQKQLGHDFSQYKEGTLTRRIQRRMQLLQIDSVETYIDRLRKEAGERDLLFRDLLISVTQFFRDPKAFAFLESEVIRRIVEAKEGAGPVRVWVAGCATGEEAYSIAILFREAVARRRGDVQVQIFATDLDEQAIQVARAGRYRNTLDADVSPARLERWFYKEGEDYCVTKPIRQMCTFSVHNIIKDPPFSRLDFLSCRNLLIYLNGTLQDHLMDAFHYALAPGGYIFLGSSETMLRSTDRFTPVNKKFRVFQRAAKPATLPSFPLLDGPRRTAPASATSGMEQRLEGGVDRLVNRALTRYSPSYVVVDSQDTVVRFSGHTARFLEPMPGLASLSIFSMLRHELRASARVALQKARTERRVVEQRNLVLAGDEGGGFVTLAVEPLAEAHIDGLAGHCVMIFREQSERIADSEPVGTNENDSPKVRQLEQELEALRAQLHNIVSDLEVSNEELKSSNEEYQLVNEELQSTNEELETAKEELQSVNEQLQTVNAELGTKYEWLSRANSDLRNFLDSTQIATLFLDTELRIRAFTPAATDILHLREGDRGRPFTELVPRISDAELGRDARRVLRTLEVIEREVHVIDGADTTYLMRIRPYRTVDNLIDGVVLTFVDVTSRKRHEAVLARLAAIVDSSADAIFTQSLDGAITSWNAAAEHIFGYRAAEAIGQPASMLCPKDYEEECSEIIDRLKRGDRIADFDTERLHKDGRRIPVAISISAIRDETGAMAAISTIARDNTIRKEAEKQRQLLLAELDHRVKNMLAVVSAIASQTFKAAVSPDHFLDAFVKRLRALATAHDLLRGGGWHGASLHSMVQAELAIFEGSNARNVLVSGDDVELTPNATLSLALAFHELATNAAKYGALSVPGGRVEVSSRLRRAQSPAHLTIKWKERGGPPVSKPKHQGFGSLLLDRSLAHELGAVVTQDFAKGGVCCTISFGLSPTIGRLRTSERKTDARPSPSP